MPLFCRYSSEIKSARRASVPILSTFPVMFLLAILYLPPCVAATPARIELHDGWALQSSCKTEERGEVISTVTFKPQGWYSATIPSTVLAAQVAAGDFKDPYFADNLRKILGMSYPIGKNFAELPMSKDSPYACSWWYRTSRLQKPCRMVAFQRNQLPREHLVKRTQGR